MDVMYILRPQTSLVINKVDLCLYVIVPSPCRMRHNEDHRTQNNPKPLNVFIRGTLFSRKLNVVRLPSPPRKQSPVPSLSAARSKKRTNQLHHTWSRLFQNLFHVVYRHMCVEKSLHPIITIYHYPVIPRSRWLGVMNSSHDAAHDARVSHHQHPPPPPHPADINYPSTLLQYRNTYPL